MVRISRRPRAFRAVTVAFAGSLALALALAGCDLLPKPAGVVRNPSVMGVVERLESTGGQLVNVTFDDGRSLQVDRSAATDLAGHGPREGDLLIFGDQPSPWHASLGPAPGDDRLFQAISTVDDAADGFITFDFGVRLPVADDYQASGRGPAEPLVPVTYLVDEEGEVVAGP